MKKDTLPTVQELNEIHRQWMALDSTGPRAEIDRVCKLMERVPKRYVSGHDGKGVVMVDGGPLNQPMDFALCVQMCKGHGGRTDIAWHGGRGEWYAL
jgi:hypothetical protein